MLHFTIELATRFFAVSAEFIKNIVALYSKGKPEFEVIACIAGRGFGVRREDMKKMLLATRGKVFTLQNLDKLVECSRLKEFRSK